ncbi:MAG: TetR/AcrR family transcriptional regulator [Brevundimonas sp.]|jgi:AcrR family transcriptional regulator|uniref:TetR/AcrR family transcriptional regulator n=1 Tax=Brevundimonas sp. TaxID=1871086 RepID=UPI00391C0E18
MTRQRDRSATEAALLAAGQGILMSQGWQGLSVQAVAEGARCDRKLVYRYFGGLDGVIDALMDEALSRFGTALDAAPALDDGADFAAFMRASLPAYARALIAVPEIALLHGWALADGSGAASLRLARANEAVQEWLRARRPRLRTPPGGDVLALNALLTGAIHHLAIHAALRVPLAGLSIDAASLPRIEAALDQALASFAAAPERSAA